MANGIVLFKLSALLPDDIKSFIGTIVTSELLHEIRKRDRLPPAERHQFSIFVDEFQHFATQDLVDIINEGRKFACSPTIAHQERLGQLRDDQIVLGATLATANKVYFQLTVADAQELAPEFARSVESCCGLSSLLSHKLTSFVKR